MSAKIGIAALSGALLCAACGAPDEFDLAREKSQELYRATQAQQDENELAFRRAGWTKIYIDGTAAEALRVESGWHFVTVDDDEVPRTAFVPAPAEGGQK